MRIMPMRELVAHFGDMKKNYNMNENIVFLGDSLTEWGNWKELLPDFDIKNYGIAGNKTYEVFNRLDNITEENPGKIFLMIGINDLADTRQIEDILKDYKLIIRYLKKRFQDSELYALSVLPIDERILNIDHFNNKKVDLLNKNIENISKNNGLRFINMNPLFTNKNGQLKSDYTFDGVHLSPEGYKLWKELINNYL